MHADDLGLCKLGGIANPDPAPVFFITAEIKAECLLRSSKLWVMRPLHLSLGAIGS